MTTISRLWTEISNKRRVSTTGQYFLPYSELRAIFTREAIKNAVAELSCAEAERIGLVTKISNEGVRLFAILLWMGRENAILDFRDHGALDARLPLPEGKAKEIAPDFGEALSGEFQWQFLPYTFTQDMRNHHTIIEAGMILPFLEEECWAEGAFGKISRMTLLSTQQEFYPDQTTDPVVIRKKLKVHPRRSEHSTHQAFKKEISCLKLLNTLRHPNIVRLLGSYTYKGEHNFLFPCLDMNLSAFLKLETRFGDFEWDLTFFSALHGLASALQNVHELHLQAEKNDVDLTAIGYHHDFRPPNILVSRNNFLLADFGLAKFKPQDDTSQTIWKVGAGDYIAPECMNEKSAHQRVGRAVDIWGFGCLLAEVVTYMERGSAGLMKFRNMRRSAEYQKHKEDTYFFGREGVKPAVSKWLKELIASPKTELLADLIQLCTTLLHHDPAMRPKAPSVCNDLAFLNVKAHFRAVQGAFAEYFRVARQQGDEAPPLMKLWFERERFNAFGIVLGLVGDHQAPLPIEGMRKLHSSSQKVFSSLFGQLNSATSRSATRLEVVTAEVKIDTRASLDEEIQSLVQDLWDMLPIKYQKKMEAVWGQASLDTEDIDRLNEIEINCRSVNRTQYSEVGASAAMKSLRLQFLKETGTKSKDYICQKEEVEIKNRVSGHFIGLYRSEKQVLIEWLYYSVKWEGTPAEQRTVLMELKAEGLGVKPKPSELRILDCLGFFEDLKEHRYGFVYALPDQDAEVGSVVPITLLDLLRDAARQRSKEKQPLLKAKFELAYALASFLNEFHSIGWVHKNINSNNVLFFNIGPDSLTSPEALRKPYVVDLQQSRPDEDKWYTSGPSDDNSLPDYRHPDYSRTSRFVPGYDYYSMGLVLLEIGYWSPLKAWSNKYPTSSPKDFQQILIDKYVPQLGQRMGQVYRDVVMTCLKGEFAGKDAPANSVDTRTPLGQFIEKVVAPLEELAGLPL